MMGKASLDTCLSSSSSPKLISDDSRKRSKGTCGTEVSPYTAEVRLCNKRTVVGLSVGPFLASTQKKRDRFLVLRIVY